MRKLISSLLLLMPLALFAQLTARSLTASDGTFIGFYEYKPADYSSSKPKYPLIVFLHGMGERGNGTNELSRLKGFAIPKYIDKGNKMTFTFNGKTETFVVVAPQLPSSKSSWPHIYTDAMIDYAIKNLNADPDRVILTGLSMGGGGVWSYASGSAANASRLAGIVPICGTCNLSNAANIANAGVAVWGFHAQGDNVTSVNCTINAVNAINSNNPPTRAQQTIYAVGGHGIWDRAYSTGYADQNPNAFEWMLQQKRKTSNKLPTANAGSDLSTNTGVASVTLNGSGADSDGSIVRYAWKKISGPAAGSISNSGNASTTITGLTSTGIYKYELTVVDNKAGWATDVVQVTVTAGTANKAPVARAGSDQTITLPANSITLNGSSSSDEDGSIKTYAWTKVSGSTANIQSSSASSTTVSGLVAGSYTFRLTVTDDKGSSHSDDVNVTVNAAANKAPVARAGSDQTITLPANSITLNGSSSSDEDGNIKSFSWTKVSGSSATIQSSSASSTTVSGLVAGSYTFRLTVTDDKGSSHSDDVNVTVNAAANKAPVARAGSDLTITLPASSVTLNGSSSSDEDGSIKKYAWTKVSGSSANIQSSSASSTTVSGLVAGSYTFRLTVTDDKGSSHSDDVNVTVNAAANKAPVARAGSDLSITLPTNSVNLNGSSSSDEDGNIKSFSWTKVSGSSATIHSASSANTTVSGLVAGSYTFRLTVTDDKGSSHSDDVIVTVIPAPINQSEPLVANAGADAEIGEPANTVNLSGSGSKGTISTYKWTLVTGDNSAWFENASAMDTRIRSLKAGTYTVRLTVTNNSGGSHSDDKIIKVKASSTNTQEPVPVPEPIPVPAPLPGQSPVANAGADATIGAPANTVYLSGSGSADPDGTIVSYQWTLVSGDNSAWFENASAENTRIRNLKPGKYTVRLTVKDNSNLTGTDDKLITVTGGTDGSDNVSFPEPPADTDTNTPVDGPKANAGSDVNIKEPANTVNLNGDQSTGNIKSYSWTLVSGKTTAWFENASAMNTRIRSLVAGTYVVRLTVTDINNKTASADKKIVVSSTSTKNDNDNDLQDRDASDSKQSPVANAGADHEMNAPANSATISGDKSYDPDGRIVKYEWSILSGNSKAWLENKNASTTRIRSMAVGTYLIRLKVTDNDGLTSTSDKKIEVKQKGAVSVGKTAYKEQAGAAGFSEEKLNVYPNPASNVINLRLANRSIGKGMINIYDVSGKIVQRVSLVKNQPLVQQSLQIQSLRAGIYHVEVVINNNTREVTRFVKQ